MILLLLAAAPDPLGGGPIDVLASGSSLGEGEQSITVYVRGADGETVITAERVGGETITLSDPGIGVLRGTFRGPPARFLQLRLVASRLGIETPLYDGLVVLSDARMETLAFETDGRGPARRLAVAPSARVDLALDERVTWWVSFGWAALTLAWVGTTGVVWALQRR